MKRHSIVANVRSTTSKTVLVTLLHLVKIAVVNGGKTAMRSEHKKLSSVMTLTLMLTEEVTILRETSLTDCRNLNRKN